MYPVFCKCFFFDISAFQYRNDINTEFLCKFIISRIMCRNSHDRSCAIACQNIIRNPDRNFFSIYRVDSISTCKYTCFFFIQFSSFKIRFRFAALAISKYSFSLLRCSDFFNIRMFRSHYTICCSKQCIASGSKYGEFLVRILDFKDYICSFGFSDPINLHLFCGLRPVTKLKVF